MGRRKTVKDENDGNGYEEEEEPTSSSKKKKKKTPPKKKTKSSSSADNDVEAPKLPNGSHLTYTDAHRAVLQYFLIKKFVLDKDLKQVTERLGKPPGQSVNSFLNEINEMLSAEDFYLMIRPREMLEEEGAAKVWGLVNTRSDEAAKQATSLEPWQVVLFNECLTTIAKSEDGTISHSEAICAYQAVPNSVSKNGNEVLKVLNKLVSLGWLKTTSKMNFFTVGPRTMFSSGKNAIIKTKACKL